MSTIDYQALEQYLTRERLGSYLRAAEDDLERAVALYDWNTSVSGALYEDIGRVEVVFRNAADRALVSYGVSSGWEQPWYRRPVLFPGKQGARALAEIETARSRATRRTPTELHGKVIAELNFGFWRFLCTKPYFTSMWVTALVQAFPNHPAASDPRAVRADVEDRMQRIHFLRNRIAHHEPVHGRDLARDVAHMSELSGWISADARKWLAARSRAHSVISRRP